MSRFSLHELVSIRSHGLRGLVRSIFPGSPPRYVVEVGDGRCANCAESDLERVPTLRLVPTFREDTRCAACGHNQASAAFIAASRQTPMAGEPFSLPDRIVRRCLRCGHEWHEQPLNASTAGSAA